MGLSCWWRRLEAEGVPVGIYILRLLYSNDRFRVGHSLHGTAGLAQNGDTYDPYYVA